MNNDTDCLRWERQPSGKLVLQYRLLVEGVETWINVPVVDPAELPTLAADDPFARLQYAEAQVTASAGHPELRREVANIICDHRSLSDAIPFGEIRQYDYVPTVAKQTIDALKALLCIKRVAKANIENGRLGGPCLHISPRWILKMIATGGNGNV
jgi:hypothetical protein